MRKTFAMSVPVLAFAVSLAAKPNFSGTWTLNVAKSDFGLLPGPASRTDVIEHNDPSLKVSVKAASPQGSQEVTISITIDGKDATYKEGDQDVTSSASWDGDTLVVNSKLKFQGSDVNGKSTWILSADGNTLTENIHYASPIGETDQKLVFEKGSGAAAATATAAASPGAHANYSGTWKLNIDKSDFGPLPPDNSRTDIIEHTDPDLKDSVSDDGAQGKMDYVLKITTDGKEATNNAGGLDAKSTANWEGANLVVNTKLSFQGTDVAIRAVWVLSPDGKTLTQNAHLNAGPIGEADQKFVFEKQ